jgi:hypothetical protein
MVPPETEQFPDKINRVMLHLVAYILEYVRSVIAYHAMALRHGATVSIASTLHVRKLTMPRAKYEITACGIGLALNGKTFTQSFVKIT